MYSQSKSGGYVGRGGGKDRRKGGGICWEEGVEGSEKREEQKANSKNNLLQSLEILTYCVGELASLTQGGNRI